MWTSRQGALHAARNPDGLTSEVLQHSPLDVAVRYESSGIGEETPSIEVIEREPLVVVDAPIRFVLELANLLRIAVR